MPDVGHHAAVLIANVPFVRVSQIEAERNDQGELILDTPHVRFANPRRLRLNAYGAGPFVRLRLGDIPTVPGVYAVAGNSDTVLYVGRAKDSLRSRWGRRGYSVIDPRNCFVGGQSTNCRINALIRDALVRNEPLSLLFHPTADPTELESRIIRAIRPPWNIFR